ncbi:bifunctional ADP-heptose synthase [Trichothermofontia sichuanensis B231]|uniref:bifunctional heptose 7-phosphate kinase/heptose 1-phosphate adenyltransferase n=1 Tax=Trichothermofontia sichuanensis TaxID=3045816 RepID=UPI002246ADA8|nr:PfkB family carbohydrate kinase [Trichothermofontia sichuanensis]UZQ56158.1 bifunctional ADP-heptose synthase [Trichothermofontia sichuanensis B231]
MSLGTALDAAFCHRLRVAAPRLQEILAQFHQARVLVVGDLTLDEFLTGQVERLSREAPVLILRHEETRQVPGGGANAIYNLATLGAQVQAVGLVGADAQGEVLRRLFSEVGVDTNGIFVDRDRPTVTKTRISGHARQSVTQQIVRVDRRSDALPHPDLQHQLAAYIQAHQPHVDAIVCSDYGDGVLTAPVITAALAHPRTIVDAQAHLTRYRGAMVFTPNLPEAELAVGYPIRDLATLQQAGRDLLALTDAHYLLITRGEEGMALWERQTREPSLCQTVPAEATISLIPAFNKTDVFDVTGAGDTVVAALTLALVAGASAWEAAVLGNLAASLVVRQFGTSTTTPTAIQAALQALLEQIDGCS